MSGRSYALDPRLAADTRPLAQLPLCELRLMDDARFGWLVLIPRREGLVEVDELEPADQVRLWDEILQASAALRACLACDKLNLGALGNIVRQLHIHIVARREGDAAWPGPVWGSGAPEPYSPERRETLLAALRQALGDAAK